MMDFVSFLVGALTMLAVIIVLAGWAVLTGPRENRDPHGNDPTAAIRKARP
jgi:hypothetical protein